MFGKNGKPGDTQGKVPSGNPEKTNIQKLTAKDIQYPGENDRNFEKMGC